MTSEVRDERARFVPLLIVPAWLVLSLMLTVAGPFGTYGSVALRERAMIWLGLAAFGLCVAVLLMLIGNRYKDSFGPYFIGLLTAAGTSLIFTPVFIAVMKRMTADEQYVTPNHAEVALFIFSATAGICALREIWAGEKRADAVPLITATPVTTATETLTEPSVPRVVTPRLLERLPHNLRGDLFRISVRDHYVDVTTSRGTQALLMRFSDAVVEADGALGLQVHRSHWVAEQAISDVSQTRGKVVLHLIDGSDVPVSRPHMAALAERGLLQPRDNGTMRDGVPVVIATAPLAKSRVKDGLSA